MTHPSHPAPGLRVRTGLTAGETVTVYGSPTCGWTRKQLDYLKDQGMPYTFVDCDSQDCPEFVIGFPTSVRGGQTYVGYTKF